MKNSAKNKKKVLEKVQFDKTLKLIAKSSFIVFIGLVISKILTYTYRIIIARYFGLEIYGLYSLALSLFLIFITLVSLGFGDGLLKFVPLLRAKNKINEIRYLFRKTMKIYLIFGIIASIVLIASSNFISLHLFNEPNLSIFLKIMGIGILSITFSGVLLIMLKGFEEIGWYSFIFNIFQNFSKVGILVILIFMGFTSGANIVVWSFVASSIPTLFFSYSICKYKINKIFKHYKKKNYFKIRKKFFQYSWPMAFYGLLAFLFHSIDTLSLGYYKSSIEVGLYNAAVPIAATIIFVPELFMQLFFPIINREYSIKNYKFIKQLSKQVNKWIFMITFPIFVLIFLFPEVALNVLFGPQYIIAQNALKFLLVGSFISTLCVVSKNLLLMLGKSKLILLDIFITAILDIILNSILVPMPTLFLLNNSNGLVGAAIATLLSIIFLNFLFVIQTKKYLLFTTLKRKMIKILLISIIPILIIFYLRKMILINIFSICILLSLFILSYIFLIIISHSLDKNDLMIIRAFARKFFK